MQLAERASAAGCIHHEFIQKWTSHTALVNMIVKYIVRFLTELLEISS